MSNHDPLEASEWGDAISSNPQYSDLDQSIVQELSTTFANATVQDPEEGDSKHEDEDEYDDNAQDQSGMPASNSLGEDSTGIEPKSPGAEQKDTTELFSTLTDRGDNGFKRENVLSPKKDESLFKEPSPTNNNTNFPSAELHYEEKDTDQPNEGKQNNSPSPNRLRRQNMYKAPRYRRNPIKKESFDLKSETEPLGPLGTTEEDDQQQEDEEESPAQALLRQSEAPLFEINRTPLSPLKPSGPIVSGEQTEQHHAPSSPSKPKEPEFKLNITVGDPLKVGDLTSAHIVYSVRTLTDSDLLSNSETVVSRRYRDFRWLYRQLQHTHPGRIIPPPPDKQAVGRFNQDFIEGRRFALERMLIKISQNVHLQKDPDFIMFLQSERFSSEAREHEKALGANSTFNENDYNDDSLSNSGGFLSSIGGAFSFAPKVSEPDEIFKDKKSYIEALDQELKAFSRNLETVVTQRQDLAVVTEEFANIISTLADLEVSKIVVELFQEFSSTQLRIKELLERLSLQDVLTLGYTLDEYQRIVASIRSTFEQRDKIQLNFVKSEAELKKKQSSYDKAFKYNRTQTDKLEILKNELRQQESKNQVIKERFQTISKTILEELKTFEFEKINDFRNSIEIFLESTIESQKEAVELWETFYNVNLAILDPNAQGSKSLN